MDKKTMNTLHMMICGELEEIAKKGIMTHETLDIMKDLIESEKNLKKIEKYESESEEGMERGYSQRKYYIDADYNPMGTHSYAMGRMNYDMGGNSYMGYNPMYAMPMNSRGGYSRHGSNHEMAQELKEMMQEVNDESIKKAISELITKLEK